MKIKAILTFGVLTARLLTKLAKLYISSTLNIYLILWHSQLIVCDVKSWVISFIFQFFGGENVF